MNRARSSLCLLVCALLLLGLLLSKVNVPPSPSSSVSLAAVGISSRKGHDSIPFQSPVTDGFVPRDFLVPRLPPTPSTVPGAITSSLLFRSTLCCLSPNVSLPSHMCPDNPSSALHPCPLSCLLIPIRSSKRSRCPIFVESIGFNLCSQRFSPPFTRSYRCVAQASDLLMSHFDFLMFGTHTYIRFHCSTYIILFSLFCVLLVA